MAVKEENGVFLVWSSSTRARQSRNRRNCNHSATLEVQEAPSGTRTSLSSVQGALAVLLVASQLVAFVQLPEAHGGSESAPAAGAGAAGAAAEATAVAAAPGRKMSSTRTRSSIRIKSSIRASINLSSTRKGYGSRVWIRGMDQGYGSCVGPGPWSMLCIFTRIHIYIHIYIYSFISQLQVVMENQPFKCRIFDFFPKNVF